jgi:dipeptidyl aminopeptidase/acylaminoacyl peptidase
MEWKHLTPLIPRKILFGNPDKTQAQISPNGTKIGYLAPLNGVLNVWVCPSNNLDAARPVTKDTYRGIRFFVWAFTNDHILYIQDKAGEENWRIYSTNLESGEIMDLTPLEGVQARIERTSHKFPDQILISINDRVPQLHDLHLLNIVTGETRLVQKNEGFAAFITDDDFKVRFARRMTPDGGNDLLKPTKDGWTIFTRIGMEDSLTTDAIGFDKTGKILYMMDSRGRNNAALVALDTETEEARLLASDQKADLSDAIFHPTEKNAQAAAFTYERKRWQILDPTIEEDFARIRTIADGDFRVVSRTLDDSAWILAFLMDDSPMRYYLYDRERKEALFLFTDRKALEGFSLAKMNPVVIRSRDGLDLVSYFTLPVGSDSDGDGRPDKPLPLVLVVHGGPWGRDDWGFNPFHQWLANRGYAVLSVNFRASFGFGKAFTNAGNMECGAKMHDDLIDAVDWAINEKIADPERVGIFGGSYGGYATLVGMTFTPDVFACGVDIVGPSNLVTLLETIPPYWQPEVELFVKRVGDHRSEEGRALLVKRSPLNYVDRIRRPLLIGHGANDPRVKQAESDQIVKAMQQKGIPVTYVLYPDEGHGFARPENRLSFNAVAESFLSTCLGGRYEPIDEDFKGSSITVPVGAEYIPGLAKALSEKA